MNWTSFTSGGDLGPGIAIHFTEMTGEGLPPSTIKTGDTFSLDFPNGSRTAGSVTKASNTEIEVLLKDGSSYRLTPHNEGDYPVGIKSPGLHTQNWVVRETLGATANEAQH